MPNRKMAQDRLSTDFLRLQCQFPITKDTDTSRRATALVTAAKNTSKKNKAAKIEPPAMASNTFGRVTKISPGPEAGSRPQENTAGKMAMPASTAIQVSKRAICMQPLGMSTSLLR